MGCWATRPTGREETGWSPIWAGYGCQHDLLEAVNKFRWHLLLALVYTNAKLNDLKARVAVGAPCKLGYVHLLGLEEVWMAVLICILQTLHAAFLELFTLDKRIKTGDLGVPHGNLLHSY